MAGCYVCGSSDLAPDSDLRNPLCAVDLGAREHIASMQRDPGTGGSLAVCPCGWRSQVRWSERADQDQLVREHWLGLRSTAAAV